MYGFTLEDVSNFEYVAKFLRTLTLGTPRGKLWVRIVFQEGVEAGAYRSACKRISPYATIVGELLDSEGISRCPAHEYAYRAITFFEELKEWVGVWEIGNEANGSWLGEKAAAKFYIAQKYIRQKGGKTLLTLYMDEFDKTPTHPYSWQHFSRELPADMRETLDYVFMSHYPGDNNGYEPSWKRVCMELDELFPNSLLGLGEMGPSEELEYRRMKIGARMEMAKKFWRLEDPHPRWIGFGGYWYGSQEIEKYPEEFRAALQAVLQ